jgi:hypothetical protein
MKYNFQLTLKFNSTPPVTAKKTFKAQNKKTAWAIAERWRDNCLAICGKNELGEYCNDATIELT